MLIFLLLLKSKAILTGIWCLIFLNYSVLMMNQELSCMEIGSLFNSTLRVINQFQQC